MDLFRSFDEVKVSKPTLNQYIKSTEGKNRPKKYMIELIWFPGKFKTYGIQTEHFRHYVSEESDLGLVLKADLPEIFDKNICLMMSFTCEDKRLSGICIELGKVKRIWKPLSSGGKELGMKFE